MNIIERKSGIFPLFVFSPCHSTQLRVYKIAEKVILHNLVYGGKQHEETHRLRFDALSGRCWSPPFRGAGLFSPTRYTGTGTGMLDKIEVAVTFDADTITGIEVVSCNDTPGVCDAAVERSPRKS